MRTKAQLKKMKITELLFDLVDEPNHADRVIMGQVLLDKLDVIFKKIYEE